VEKLGLGKRILESEGVWQPYFMAPSHSFDGETLRALRALGFTAITDGWGIYPYDLKGLTAVPQLFSTPMHFGIGVYTIAMHTNSMSDAAISAMLRFVENNATRFVSFPEAIGLARRSVGAAMARSVTRTALTAARRLRAVASK
jgi:predicted deacetylase